LNPGYKSVSEDGKNDEELNDLVTERLKKIDSVLKQKLRNQFVSVRKAFLSLDSDHDGFITTEDFFRCLGEMREFSY
jgi:Ca2+-binding EF-hand superfamily protein